MLVAVLIVLGVLFLGILVVGLFIAGTYNSLVTLRNRFKNAFAQIDVQLKRRYDLIPNLVETAKGYMKHERETLEAVVRARQTCVDASNAGAIGDLAKAEGALARSMRSLFAVAEAYPELKANQNMLALQEELTSTENRVGFARQAYNDAAMRLNNAIEQWPSSILASYGRFQQLEFFEVEVAEERKPVKVQF